MDSSALSPIRVVYKTIDDLEIDADVYLPEPRVGSNGNDEKTKAYPLIINIHGGAFMLGSSSMINRDQVRDCLARGWIVVAPNHRLCPQVDLLEGPMADCRDLLAWIRDGGIEKALSPQRDEYAVDQDHVFAFGTSSGGTLALSLGFDVSHPVTGILDLYGPCDFANPSWSREIPEVSARIPWADMTPEFLGRVYEGRPVPIRGGLSLEGQAGAPDFRDPRTAFAQTRIARGTILDAVFPSRDWARVDPVLNVNIVGGDGGEGVEGEKKRKKETFPPTFIVHGGADTMVSIEVSRKLLARLQEAGVECGMVEVPGEPHTFAGRMEVGSRTWELQRRGFDFLEGLIGK